MYQLVQYQYSAEIEHDHADLTFMEGISITLDSPLRCAGVQFKIGGVLNHEHVARPSSNVPGESPVRKQKTLRSLPNAVDDTV